MATCCWPGAYDSERVSGVAAGDRNCVRISCVGVRKCHGSDVRADEWILVDGELTAEWSPLPSTVSLKVTLDGPVFSLQDYRFA
jgi:hypothetical protein